MGADRDVQRGLSRRGFLAAGGAGAVGAMGLGLPARRAHAHPNERRHAANLIFMVSDGMSAGTLALGDLLHQRLRGERSSWAELMRHERTVRALIDTRSADSFVTDSAASSSAWAIGSLVNNGAISVLPDGTPRKPLFLTAKEAGRATGLVTTTRVTHATPAGFAANAASRDREPEIASQLLDRKFDLVMGGGARYFKELPLKEHRLVRTRNELHALTPDEHDRILGIFSDSHMSFEVERPDSEPSIVEMTRFALRTLSRRKGGFVLQIEGGRVDHAAHNNDTAGLLYDQIAFDYAVAAAAEFALARQDTLLIVTTDHATANPALTDYGAAGAAGLERIVGMKRSFEWIQSQFERSPDRSAASLGQIVHQATGLEIAEAESQILARWVAGEQVDPFGLANAKLGPLGSIIANHTAVAYLSPNHTCDFVELTALGPGSSRVRPFMPIHEVHDVVRGALDLPPAKPM